jgi:hypothetical protein
MKERVLLYEVFRMNQLMGLNIKNDHKTRIIKESILGGGVDEEWAAKGNWVPFHGIAKVKLNIFNPQLNKYELKLIDGWMIKPPNGRIGEHGDELISNLIGNTVGTNGVKNVDYPSINFSKEITDTQSATEMNNWLRNMGYDITPINGFLPYLKPPNELISIP